MFVEVSTSIEGACLFLQALARVNVLDCLNDPVLRRELAARSEDPASCIYRRESPDVWTSLSVYVKRIGLWRGPTRRRIVLDCEDATGMRAAYLALRLGRAWVCITQPHGEGMAHAYARRDEGGEPGEVDDACVDYGMKPPKPTFYDDPSAETACLLVEVKR